MVRDTEKDGLEVHYVTGYASLAQFIASDRDKSTAIYRRFDRLSARNLLYLQSEIAELEGRQERYDREDLRSTIEQKASCRDWITFRERASTIDNDRDRKRMELVIEIREKLKEYREAVLLESTLLSLKPPQKRTLTAFRNVFHNVGGKLPEFPMLDGHSAEILDNADDLMALHPRADEDRLTQFMRNYLPILFVTKRTSNALVYISERRLHFSVAVINLILAAGLLFGAIYTLYKVNDNEKRLGLITGFTVAFAVCVGLVTQARRAEVFAACAAYAAVLVVFVSGNLKSGG